MYKLAEDSRSKLDQKRFIYSFIQLHIHSSIKSFIFSLFMCSLLFWTNTAKDRRKRREKKKQDEELCEQTVAHMQERKRVPGTIELPLAGVIEFPSCAE